MRTSMKRGGGGGRGYDGHRIGVSDLWIFLFKVLLFIVLSLNEAIAYYYDYYFYYYYYYYY